MTIKDFKREGRSNLHYENDKYIIGISKKFDSISGYTGKWECHVRSPEIYICATYPRRIDAINGLDKLLRVFK